MTTRLMACVDCGTKHQARVGDPRPVCEPCIAAFVARGCRSNPFWQYDDMALQHAVNMEIGDL